MEQKDDPPALTRINQNAALLVKPQAVRPTNLPAHPQIANVITRIQEAAGGRTISHLRTGGDEFISGRGGFGRSAVEAIEVGGKRVAKLRETDITAEAEELELQEVALGTPPAKRRKVEFYLEDSHGEDPDDDSTTTKLNSQVWIWGALILVTLGVITYRSRF